MNRFNETFTDICKSSNNTIKNVQTKLWWDRRNYLTLLFVLAMIMVGLFLYYQYSQRHYVLIGSTQKQLNNNLNNDINRLKNLTNRLNAFRSISQKEAISDYSDQLKLKVQKTEDVQIIDSFKLLDSCNKTRVQNNELLIQYIEGIKTISTKLETQ